MFENHISVYNNVLKNSAYMCAEIQFKGFDDSNSKKSRNMIRYTLPFNQLVSIMLGHKFLKLIDKYFPKATLFIKYFIH